MTAIPSSKVNQSEKNTFISIQENTFTPQVLGSLYSDPVPDLIDQLLMCESSGNQNAINPRDLDGTPSYGLFQFKPSTWKLYVKKYDLFEWERFDEVDWHNTMMNGELQRIVVELMFRDPQVRLRTREFPGCSKKLGLLENYSKQ
jgi:hypothetical protein